MPAIQTVAPTTVTPARPRGAVARRTERAIAEVEHATLVRHASVRGDEVIAREKSMGMAHIVREAVGDHAQVIDTAMRLAGASDFKFNELMSLAQLNRVAQERIILHLSDDYCRE